MSWRPDYWKIPDEVWAYNQEAAYEAGADAMLEALKKEGWRKVPSIDWLLHHWELTKGDAGELRSLLLEGE